MTGNYYDEVTNMSIVPNATKLTCVQGKWTTSVLKHVANLTDEDAPLGGNNILSNFVRTNTFYNLL